MFGSMDVTDNDLLLVRVVESTNYWIHIISRQTGELINKFPSMCDHHNVYVSKNPQKQGYAFEYCSTCEEMYVQNTGERFSVHKGSKIGRMCHGPAGSLLVVETDGRLSKLTLNKTQDRAQSVFVQNIAKRPGKRILLRLCYAECHDIFMYTMKDKREGDDYEIIAVRLGSDTIVWRLSGPVDGHIIKPDSMTCDLNGNVYINDQGNNRILKINSLTGEILSILLLEEDAKWIRSIRWSNTEPNLTLSTKNKISTYFVPK